MKDSLKPSKLSLLPRNWSLAPINCSLAPENTIKHQGNAIFHLRNNTLHKEILLAIWKLSRKQTLYSTQKPISCTKKMLPGTQGAIWSTQLHLDNFSWHPGNCPCIQENSPFNVGLIKRVKIIGFSIVNFFLPGCLFFSFIAFILISMNYLCHNSRTLAEF